MKRAFLRVSCMKRVFLYVAQVLAQVRPFHSHTIRNVCFILELHIKSYFGALSEKNWNKRMKEKLLFRKQEDNNFSTEILLIMNDYYVEAIGTF